MKKLTFIALPAILILSVLLKSNQATISTYHSSSPSSLQSSINPPAARTGAPGESNCTGCHAGTAQSAAGVIDVTFSGAGNEYVVGQSYTFTISVASGAKNGFEATLLDGSNIKAGTFNSGSNYSVTTSGGRQYVRQNVASGITSWTINWTAPSTDMGDLTLYFAFNKSNNMNNAGGDIIYIGQYQIQSASFNTVTEYEKIDESIGLLFNSELNAFHVTCTLQDESDLLLVIQDLSGKVTERVNLGKTNESSYEETIYLSEKLKPGVYIASLFINNQAFNRKVYLD